MEKEKKGLFGRLLDFWREKISVGETDSIGFWNDTEITKNHFAEMGAVVSLSQEETKKAFWEEAAETETEKEQEDKGFPVEGEKLFFVPEEEKREKDSVKEAEETSTEEVERRVSKMFAAEVFWNGGRKTEETEKNELGKAFMWEMPEEEKTMRNIIPVVEEIKQKEETAAEPVQEFRMEEMPKREEKQAETQIDIEKLMRQMTKKLWEERESCGRRLR